MRKIVDKIEITSEDLKKYIELTSNSSAANNIINTLLNMSYTDVNEKILSFVVDKALKNLGDSSKELEDFRLYLINTYVKPEYQTDDYNWYIDTGRCILEISKDE